MDSLRSFGVFVAHGDFFCRSRNSRNTRNFFLIFLSPTDDTDDSDFFFFFFDSLVFGLAKNIARQIYTDVTRCARDFVECALSPLRGFVLVVSLPGVDTPVYVLLSLRDLVTRFARSDARTERPYSLLPTPCSLFLLPCSFFLKECVIVAEGEVGGISFDWSCDKFTLFIIYNKVGSVFDSYEFDSY